jgi:hypothetical protein
VRIIPSSFVIVRDLSGIAHWGLGLPVGIFASLPDGCASLHDGCAGALRCVGIDVWISVFWLLVQHC